MVDGFGLAADHIYLEQRVKFTTSIGIGYCQTAIYVNKVPTSISKNYVQVRVDGAYINMNISSKKTHSASCSGAGGWRPVDSMPPKERRAWIRPGVCEIRDGAKKVFFVPELLASITRAH